MEPVKHIVIADPDIEYIKSYEEDFLIRFRDRASIQIITEAEYLENYFRLHRDIDVLLIAKEFYGVYLKEHNISHMMLLNEKKTVNPDGGDGPYNILSYRSKEEIFTFVENGLSSEGQPIDFAEINDNKEERSRTKVVTVYSPVGGCGKSLCAVALARKLKKLGESVLVIGCDDLQSVGVFLGARTNADPELALRLQEISEDTYWSVLKNIYMEEVSFLLPFEKPLSELGIGAEQLFDLISLLKEKRDFSYIVLDPGCSLNKKVQTLISLSDICVFIAESKMSSCRMMEKFMMNMDLLSIDRSYTIANQYRTEGFRLENDNLFGSFAGYETALEAMEDPVFYRLALDIT